MLTITVPGVESFDNEIQQFVYSDGVELTMEHSLASVSKWESIWGKPFLGKDEKTAEEAFSYVKLMCLTPRVPEEVFYRLSQENYTAINNYIGEKMTATWFNETHQKPSTSSEVITSEIIYYWMFSLSLPLECETWHLNRLTTLIKVMNLKNQPKKKMSQSEVLARQRELNARRRSEFNNA